MAAVPPFMDLAVLAPDDLLSEAPVLPQGLVGAILFGSEAKPRREEAFRWRPDLRWRHAEALDRVVGESHASFPSHSAFVIDLTLPPGILEDWLKRPEAWWPLCQALRGTPRLVRLNLPPGSQHAAHVKQIVRRFPDARFWIDPFVYGPHPGWQAQVRLAENRNVFLTTRGLLPGPGGLWDEGQIVEALHFLVGEVGAGTLLYASGASWEDLLAGRTEAGRAWLADCGQLDGDELMLVFCETAQTLLGESDTSLLSVLP